MKKPTYVPHLLTYLFASQFCYGKNVIDIGCGDGYGLQLLSTFAKSCVGLDISPNALRISQMHKYHCATVTQRLDLEHEPLAGSWDYLPSESVVYVALEVLEHIDNPQILKDKGLVVFSVPFNYPHALHKTTYTNEEQVMSLFPGRKVEVFYQTEFSIVKDKPASFVRYVGVVHED